MNLQTDWRATKPLVVPLSREIKISTHKPAYVIVSALGLNARPQVPDKTLD
jgi:hypothetical protein